MEKPKHEKTIDANELLAKAGYTGDTGGSVQYWAFLDALERVKDKFNAIVKKYYITKPKGYHSLTIRMRTGSPDGKYLTVEQQREICKLLAPVFPELAKASEELTRVSSLSR